MKTRIFSILLIFLSFTFPSCHLFHKYFSTHLCMNDNASKYTNHAKNTGWRQIIWSQVFILVILIIQFL